MLPRDKTLTDAIYRLQSKGFDKDFKLVKNRLKCVQTNTSYTPSEMFIVGSQRFNGISKHSDVSTLFVIECKDGIKGLIVFSFGVYGDVSLIKFLDKTKIKEL